MKRPLLLRQMHHGANFSKNCPFCLLHLSSHIPDCSHKQQIEHNFVSIRLQQIYSTIAHFVTNKAQSRNNMSSTFWAQPQFENTSSILFCLFVLPSYLTLNDWPSIFLKMTWCEVFLITVPWSNDGSASSKTPGCWSHSIKPLAKPLPTTTEPHSVCNQVTWLTLA